MSIYRLLTSLLAALCLPLLGVIVVETGGGTPPVPTYTDDFVQSLGEQFTEGQASGTNLIADDTAMPATFSPAATSAQQYNFYDSSLHDLETTVDQFCKVHMLSDLGANDWVGCFFRMTNGDTWDTAQVYDVRVYGDNRWQINRFTGVGGGTGTIEENPLPREEIGAGTAIDSSDWWMGISVTGTGSGTTTFKVSWWNSGTDPGNPSTWSGETRTESVAPVIATPLDAAGNFGFSIRDTGALGVTVVTTKLDTVVFGDGSL